jgi:hypothetical protein
MMLGRRQFFRFLAGAAASPLAARIAVALPVLEPVRVRALTFNDITREAVQLFRNSDEFIRNIDRQYCDQHAPTLTLDGYYRDILGPAAKRMQDRIDDGEFDPELDPLPAKVGSTLHIRLPKDYQVCS